MRYLKLLLQLILGASGIIVLCLIVMLNAESYEIVKNDHADVEIKKFFGKKISESSIDSNGFYDGPAKSWHLLSNNLRNEGQFQKGYWHGHWKDYDSNGHLAMIRVWNKGKLNRLFLPEGPDLIEIRKENWPEYIDIIQHKPQRKKDWKSL